MARYSTAFLRQPGLIKDCDALPVEMGRHSDERANRYDAGATDTGDDNSDGFLQGCGVRYRDRRQILRRGKHALFFAQCTALDGHETWAESIETRVILVA